MLQAFASGTLLVTNSLLSGNTAGIAGKNCETSLSFDGSITSGGGNVSDGTTCAAFLGQGSDLNDVEAGVAALADNGGRTQTHAIQDGSPAIGNAVASAVTTDQRGATRDADPDSGAFEFDATVPAAVAP